MIILSNQGQEISNGILGSHLPLNYVFDICEHVYFISFFVGFNVNCNLYTKKDIKIKPVWILLLNITQTLIRYLWATSSIKGIMSSTDSPLSSLIFGGYQDIAMTPENEKEELAEFVLAILCYIYIDTVNIV